MEHRRSPVGVGASLVIDDLESTTAWAETSGGIVFSMPCLWRCSGGSGERCNVVSSAEPIEAATSPARPHP